MTVRAARASGDLATLAETVLSVGRKIHVRELDDPEAIPLGTVEVLVMRHVDAHPGISPSAVGRGLGLRSGNTSAALRSLEAKGLLTRRPDTADRRAVHLDPTPLAHANLERVRTSWRRLLEPLVPAGLDLTCALEVLDAVDRALTG